MWFQCRRRPRPVEVDRGARPKVMLRIRPNDGQALDYVGRVRAAISERRGTTTLRRTGHG